MMWTSLSILLVILATGFDISMAVEDEQLALQELLPMLEPPFQEDDCGNAPPVYCSASNAFGHRGVPCIPNFEKWCTDINTDRFRTFDGTCNHANNLGAAAKEQVRLLPNSYDDRSDHPRTLSSVYTPLSSPRAISLAAHPDEDRFNEFSPLVMQWGQWLDHDITFTPIASEEIPGLTCCREEGDDEPLDEHCFTIDIAEGDPTFPAPCMEFVRSISESEGTLEHPREQLNLVTAFVDASQIYGSSEELAEELRDEETSYLLRSVNGLFLPEAEEGDCIIEDGDDYCFLAGDVRVNEQPGLSGMHTLWVREHNRIATELASGSSLSDNEIFERTRKIVGALQQVITYNEWLPIILGSAADAYKLPSTEGRCEYLPGVDPTILTEFSSAAMRFGHSLITRFVRLNGEDIPLSQLFNRPGVVVDNYDDVFQSLLGRPGESDDSVQSMDRFFVEEISQLLFTNLTVEGLGFDLVALNIQRGRDHGVQPFTKYRNLCGLPPITSFHDPALGDNGLALAEVYENVDDIDLFVGLMYERQEELGGIDIGPTLQCLLGSQFFNLKYGDRFFFSTESEKIGFTDDQLAALRATRFSSIICENTGINRIQPDAFRLETSPGNNRRGCNGIRNNFGLDLSPFRE